MVEKFVDVTGEEQIICMVVKDEQGYWIVEGFNE